jgi:streptomycin 6-kinase
LTLHTRAEALAREWGLAISDTRETPTSLLAFATRGTLPVVLKVSSASADEWRSGMVVRAFDGHGMVRAYEYAEGAVLLERLSPGTSLAELALKRKQVRVTEIVQEERGIRTTIRLPSGGEIGLYQPTHRTAIRPRASPRRR